MNLSTPIAVETYLQHVTMNWSPTAVRQNFNAKQVDESSPMLCMQFARSVCEIRSWNGCWEVQMEYETKCMDNDENCWIATNDLTAKLIVVPTFLISISKICKISSINSSVPQTTFEHIVNLCTRKIHRSSWIVPNAWFRSEILHSFQLHMRLWYFWWIFRRFSCANFLNASNVFICLTKLFHSKSVNGNELVKFESKSKKTQFDKKPSHKMNKTTKSWICIHKIHWRFYWTWIEFFNLSLAYANQTQKKMLIVKSTHWQRRACMLISNQMSDVSTFLGSWEI